ncbi:MAG: o-succinylbenzoate synthase [Candidatus Promineifilaceae bacterium]|nr:o-succinylbenzoate synthase [Anaerolineaceae bacterium]
MKIERIDLYYISMPLVSPFGTSFGVQTQRDALILAMHGDGLTGWGECVATNDPGYSYETAVTAWHILSDFLIPTVLGKELEEPEQLQSWFSKVRGHPLAKAALDQAAWDITAQRDGLSLAQKLAQPYPEGPKARVQVGVSIGTQPSIAQTMEVIGKHLGEGYGRIKLKIKPGWDVKLAWQARHEFPNVPIMLDANSAYTLDDAVIFQSMDDLNLLMIEQPLGYEDIYDHSQLRPQIKSPLCLDESIHSAEHARYAIALQACDIINIKPSRVSGWTEARKVHDLGVAHGLGLWVGGMLETGVGRAAQLALASLPGISLPGDISATSRYYAHDIATPFFLNAEDSTITVPTAPGLGIEVDMARLKEVTLRQQSFTL